ncbi:hypothetical protein KQ876_00470 [Mycoplasma sp. CSL7491-lung]|uniref:MAG5620 family putative phospho-sugar mutase n=1 Tax=Mycoplasma sp. CSL7491-lung TaxID=549718 RepID=UPI001C10E33A|nr:hypothetical protein [Mycoplasma sp. CSL7491-lung]MBU4692684.1 hypothetical protein [Mycoplasma sp. CSL7491-lung]
MNKNLFKSWYSLYHNESIFYSTYEEFISKFQETEQSNLDILKQPKSTIYGIEFDSNWILGLNNFNLFTILSITEIFCSNLRKNNRKILMGKNKNIDNKIFNSMISIANKNGSDIFTYNTEEINEFIILNTLRGMDIKHSILLDYNPTNNKYYIKIYNSNEMISIDDQNIIIEALNGFNKFIIPNNNYDTTVLNIEKLFKVIDKKIIEPQIKKFKKIYKKPQFHIQTLISNKQDNYIVTKMLSNSGFKVSKLQSSLSKNIINDINFYNLYKLFNTTTYKADLIIKLDQNSNLSMIVRVKNSYIKLSEDELIYLYISYSFLKWKKSGETIYKNIFLPHDVSSNILNLMNMYSISYRFENELKSNDVLLAYNKNKFSNSNNYNLNLENFDFILNYCLMLYDYKINNNLFAYKYKKMIDDNSNILIKNYSYKMTLEKSILISDKIIDQSKISKKYKLDNLTKINVEVPDFYYLLKGEIKSKNRTNNFSLTYDKSKQKMNFKIEVESKNKKTSWISDLLYSKKLQIQLNKLIKKWHR